jgi:hypothetical protein
METASSHRAPLTAEEMDTGELWISGKFGCHPQMDDPTCVPAWHKGCSHRGLMFEKRQKG